MNHDMHVRKRYTGKNRSELVLMVLLMLLKHRRRMNFKLMAHYILWCIIKVIVQNEILKKAQCHLLWYDLLDKYVSWCLSRTFYPHKMFYSRQNHSWRDGWLSQQESGVLNNWLDVKWDVPHPDTSVSKPLKLAKHIERGTVEGEVRRARSVPVGKPSDIVCVLRSAP